MTTAVEVAAGGKLYQLVVDTEQTGKALLKKGKLKSRVTIIPLNKIASKVIPDSKIEKARKVSSKVDPKSQVNRALDLVKKVVRRCPGRRAKALRILGSHASSEALWRERP